MRGKMLLFLLLNLVCSGVSFGQLNSVFSLGGQLAPLEVPEGVKAVSVLVSRPGIGKMQPFEVEAEFFYDEQARVVKSYTYDIDKSIWGEAVYTSMQEYVYNEKSQLMEHYRESGGGHYTSLTGYEYAADGKMSHITFYNADGSVRKRQEVSPFPAVGSDVPGPPKRIVQDTLANGFVERVEEPDGKLLTEQRIMLNEQGQVAHILTVNSRRQHISIVNYKYDAEGKVVEETVVDKKGNVVTKYNYTYSKSGFLMKTTLRGKKDKVVKVIKYEYESH